VPASLVRNSATAEPQKQSRCSGILRGKKRGRAKIPSPQPLSFLPARAKIIKIQRPDFREKKFGFCSGQTAYYHILTRIDPDYIFVVQVEAVLAVITKELFVHLDYFFNQ